MFLGLTNFRVVEYNGILYYVGFAGEAFYAKRYIVEGNEEIPFIDGSPASYISEGTSELPPGLTVNENGVLVADIPVSSYDVRRYVSYDGAETWEEVVT